MTHKKEVMKMVVEYLCIIVCFSLFSLPVAGKIVQCTVLHEGSEGKDEADRNE